MGQAYLYVPKDVQDRLIEIGDWTEQDRAEHDKVWQAWADELDRQIMEELPKVMDDPFAWWRKDAVIEVVNGVVYVGVPVKYPGEAVPVMYWRTADQLGRYA